LFREKDKALAWDFTETTELKSDKLETKQIRKFSLDGGFVHIHVEDWHRVN
jgi:hypothetical protein